ncbi:hypothetical protein H8356DRAFT_1350449 [Neocallimastix lanati (nom. inval.)]|nr:hypothetical protein H8356DRAFT_1350449 [Neocallimastix sp. JGI-2020a]
MDYRNKCKLKIPLKIEYVLFNPILINSINIRQLDKNIILPKEPEVTNNYHSIIYFKVNDIKLKYSYNNYDNNNNNNEYYNGIHNANGNSNDNGNDNSNGSNDSKEYNFKDIDIDDLNALIRLWISS